ncbi:urease accessory protein UreH domain-containing protein [Pelosinus propionicus]|uniref:Sulfite exporter TauE/SafE n=1 Tax=Pelosinus propionicus DSM 13327 TaxID=1123291 RepID=A0A1I4NW43_9FIRM|nr:sulfite exporter TauE/SafE family protein [Pelosinus propionicus]SFM19625.1 Sulfite exporter TauE/SafE [Pelosinus propionicus DSM 13327]
MIAETIHIRDMYCITCEGRIEKAVTKVTGVVKVKANYVESKVYVQYDSLQTSQIAIKEAIQSAGYFVGEKHTSNAIKPLLGISLIFLAILLLGQNVSEFDMNSKLKGEVTYFVLFIIGIFTSFHCIGMCGGIMLSQSLSNSTNHKPQSFFPSLYYNMGRVLGYTMLGGVVGTIGSVLSLSIGFMAGISIFAGIFMIIMGLNMAGLNLFRSYLRIPLPAFTIMPKAKTPFAIGILNGLMPCGPLQTMQLYALGTGSAVLGASSMLFFSLGTVPLMLSFGTISGFFNKNSTKQILKLSGVLVIVLGMIMTNRGLAIAGFNLPLFNLPAQSRSETSMAAKAQLDNGIQTVRMSANNQGYAPNVLYVQKGIPLKWVIIGEQINSCNNEVIVPSLQIKKKLVPGENIIEFTPQDQDLPFSCWMGMIRGLIKVVDDVNAVDVAKETTAIPAGSGCCSTNGSSSCCSPPLQASIYGDDLNKVSTEKIIRKATLQNKLQTINIKGIGYEFDPLIMVLEKTTAKLAIDLSTFDDPEGTWDIVDYQQKKIIASFEGKKEIVNIQFTPPSIGTFGIYKNRQATSIIEVVEKLENTNLEKVRAKFL